MVVSSDNNNNIQLLFPLLLCAAFAMMDAASTPQVNVLTEIKRVLADHKDVNNVVEYLSLSENEILEALAKSQTGTDKSFTFFAPTDWGFISMLPQDIFDPFFKDAPLRETTLLHHFVKGTLSKDDLLKSTELIMVDQKPSKLVATPEGLQINGASIKLLPIPLGSNLGVVYIVDRVFTTHDEIRKAIRRHPVSQTPWGVPVLPPGVGIQESQTESVDLVAELLREEASAQH